MWKRFFMVLGVIFFCLIIAGTASFLVLNLLGGRFDKESKKFADEAITAIVSRWEPMELISRAAPELLRATPADKIVSLFGTFLARLGPLKTYVGAKGQAGFSVSAKERTVTANYVAEASFEKADAVIRVTLIRRGGAWQIFEFRVNSEAFVQ